MIEMVSLHSVTQPSGMKMATAVLASGTTQLDKEFILLVRTVNPHEPRVFVEIAEDGSTATMVTLAPHIELADEKCELIFIVDQSGSMNGSKIDQARKAMNVCVAFVIAAHLMSISPPAFLPLVA